MALKCDVCNLWIHIKCGGISIKLYKAMLEENVGKGDDSWPWYCSACKRGAKQLRLQVLAIQCDSEAMRKELTQTTAQCTSNTKEISTLETRVGALEAMLMDKCVKIDKMWEVEDTFRDHIVAITQQGIEDNISKSQTIKEAFSEAAQEAIGSNSTLDVVVQAKVNEAMNQVKAKPDPQEIRQQVFYMKQVEERKNNLIIHNLQEERDASPDKVKKNDMDTFLEISEICGAQISVADILDCRRIGRNNNQDKNRPVLIKMASNEKKRSLFLKLGAWRKYQEENRGPEDVASNKPLINIDHDMTQDQRKDRKFFLEESKNLNAKLPGDAQFKWSVRGPPWNMRLQKVIKEVPPQL